MASQVFDIRTSKGMTRAQSNEHLRCFSQQAFEAKLLHNFDPSRERLNFEVKPSGTISPLDKSDPINARIKRSLQSRGIKNPNEGMDSEDPRRKNSVIDIIFQGSRERMRELAFGDQEIEENNGEEMYKFACDKFGEKNVAAFVVHLDELNPHIHCTVIPAAIKKNKGRTGFEYQSKKDPNIVLPYLQTGKNATEEELFAVQEKLAGEWRAASYKSPTSLCFCGGGLVFVSFSQLCRCFFSRLITLHNQYA